MLNTEDSFILSTCRWLGPYKLLPLPGVVHHAAYTPYLSCHQRQYIYSVTVWDFLLW